MIISMDGRTKIEGNVAEVMSELTNAIRGVYQSLAEKDGEEHAMMMIAKAGKLAVMSDEEIEQETKELLESVLSDLSK